MTNLNNDTLLLALWTLRQDNFEHHSPDVRQRYEVLMTELVRRRELGVITLWQYMFPIVNNDLSYLSDIDYNFINAFVTPIFKVA